MYRKVATTIELFAFDASTGLPKSGDAANITAYVIIDHAAPATLADTSAAEIDSTKSKGWYKFDVAASETDGHELLFTGKSTTSNIVVVARLVVTRPMPDYQNILRSGSTGSVANLAASTPDGDVRPGDTLRQLDGASAGQEIIVATTANMGTATPTATALTGQSWTAPSAGVRVGVIKTGGVVPTLEANLPTRTQATAIQAQTDKFQFDGDNFVKSNIRSVLDSGELGGVGTDAEPWGPQ